MNTLLTDKQQAARECFKAFAECHVAPFAEQYDQTEEIPRNALEALRAQGYLGYGVPRPYGKGADITECGLLCEEMGRASTAVLSLLTVHSMVAQALARWGSPEQRDCWLPKLASGGTLAAVAITEVDVGSDAAAIETAAVEHAGGYTISGRKKWVSFGQVADVFLVFARTAAGPVAFLLNRETAGLSIAPIRGMLGFRGAMLAELTLQDCYVPGRCVVGKAGFGMSHVGSAALDVGRYCVAWGCVGLARACVEECVRFTTQRRQFRVPLRKHQLIQQMVSDMVTELEAARLLCLEAARQRERLLPESVVTTQMAKYFSSRVAARAATDAVQIHGAIGCSRESPVQRYFRDAKIMEIIEGTSQIQQMTIARHAYRTSEAE